MPNGLYTARKLKKMRRKMRHKSKDYVLRLKRREEKKGPLEGAPMGRGGVRYKVNSINGVDLGLLVLGKAKKPMR